MKKLLVTLAIALAIVTVFGAAMYALNLYTGPIIANNKLAAVRERLDKVMPGAESYTEITDTFETLPENITNVYKETSGKGFVVLVTAKSDYSKAPMEITLGVDAEGKITGINIESYNDTADFDFRSKDPEYLASYTGKDSALADIGTVSGSTYSSKAFKGAIESAMLFLADNGLIKAGEKSPEQILTELIPTVHSAMAPDGILMAEKLAGNGNVTLAYKSTNNTGFAIIMAKGGASYLVIVDVDGTAKIYDITGADVTAANADLTTEALAFVESAKLSDLLVVLPGGVSFEEVDISELGLSENVLNVYKETTGVGFVFRVTSTGYQPGMEIIVGIDADGKVVGSKCLATNDTFKKEPELDNKYNGQTLDTFSEVIIGGATMTSNGYRDAVNTALQAFVLASGGELDPAIVLKGMIPAFHTGMAPGGVLKATAVAASGNIVEGYKAVNNSGYAFIIKNGDVAVLAVVNASGVCKVYDVEGADVTESNADAVAEAVAAATPKDFSVIANNSITNKFADASEITAIELTTFNNVVYACSFISEGNTYYAFISSPLSYGDSAMEICTILDENGAIATQSIKQMAFGHGVEYIPGIKDYINANGNPYKNYLDQFAGLTEGTLTDDVLITGATVTSSAVKGAVAEVFAAFNIVKGGN